MLGPGTEFITAFTVSFPQAGKPFPKYLPDIAARQKDILALRGLYHPYI
jgi:hypothetical protein